MLTNERWASPITPTAQSPTSVCICPRGAEVSTAVYLTPAAQRKGNSGEKLYEKRKTRHSHPSPSISGCSCTLLLPSTSAAAAHCFPVSGFFSPSAGQRRTLPSPYYAFLFSYAGLWESWSLASCQFSALVVLWRLCGRGKIGAGVRGTVWEPIVTCRARFKEFKSWEEILCFWFEFVKEIERHLMTRCNCIVVKSFFPVKWSHSQNHSWVVSIHLCINESIILDGWKFHQVRRWTMASHAIFCCHSANWTQPNYQ